MARKIVIMGLGLFGGGLAAAKYFSSLHENVYVTDLRKAEELQESLSKLKDYPITYCLGKHNEDDFKDADLIIVNPGVPESSKFLNIAREHGVPIDTEINIVLRKIPAKVIGITGSNGKSTTTAMIHHILQYHGYKVWLGGNIGHSLLSDIDTIKKDDIVVLELSSFQLERLNKSPHIAVITNFSKNHLDRHKTMENYAKAKQNIFRYQESDGICILNGNDAALMKWIPDIPGKYKRFGLESDVFIEDQAIFANIEGKKGYIINIKDLPLSGRANYENAMAAILAVLSFNKTLKNIDKALMTFQGLPHRMELVGIYNGCKIYNDSDATTAESTIAAITSVPPPIILIAGGVIKVSIIENLALLYLKE